MSTSFSLHNVFKIKCHTCFNIRLISFKTLIAFGSPFSAFSKIICNLSSRISAVVINLFTSIASKSILLPDINQFELIIIIHLFFYEPSFPCICQPKRYRLPIVHNFFYYYKRLLIKPPALSITTSLNNAHPWIR